MVPWYTFYQSPFEPETKYGPYEHLISRVSFGPTQAERVLIHTHVVETAHERRFCIAQDSTDMSQFQASHTRRIAECLDRLEKHFMSAQSDVVDELSPPEDLDVIGIVPASSGWQARHDHLSHLPWVNNTITMTSDSRKRPSSSPVSDWKRICLEPNPLEAEDTDSSWSPVLIGRMAAINRAEADLRRTVSFPPRQQRETRQRREVLVSQCKQPA